MTASSPPRRARPRLAERLRRPQSGAEAASPVSWYAFAGLVASLSLALTFWLILWTINGLFTVAFFQLWGMPAGYSWLAHVIISVVEHHLWRAKHILRQLGLAHLWRRIRWGVYPLTIAVGVLDVGTAAWGFMGYAERHGLPAWQPTWTEQLIPAAGWTIIAEVIAIAPEPLIVATAVILWHLLRRHST